MKQINDDFRILGQREHEATAARARILRQAERQQNTLAVNFEDLLGDGGPVDETADDMNRAIREWRDSPSDRNLD